MASSNDPEWDKYEAKFQADLQQLRNEWAEEDRRRAEDEASTRCEERERKRSDAIQRQVTAAAQRRDLLLAEIDAAIRAFCNVPIEAVPQEQREFYSQSIGNDVAKLQETRRQIIADYECEVDRATQRPEDDQLPK